jgi:hypothetical protein
LLVDANAVKLIIPISKIKTERMFFIRISKVTNIIHCEQNMFLFIQKILLIL